MKAYGEADVQIDILAGREWSASRPSRFTPGKEPQVPIG
jgi:hypothetical protein